MGSFYTLCSITNRTITDRQEMVIQFMVPTTKLKKDKSIGEYFVDSFLKTVKTKGLKEAQKSFELATRVWGDELHDKGMVIVEEGEWTPVGPAIRGTYDDCGDIAPSQDEENLKRIAFLEQVFFDVPFKSIMGAATDQRWYKYGVQEGDKTWQLEGITKDLPEPAMLLFKSLSVTYMHASVYDTITKEDFCSEDGVLKCSYNKKWRNEYFSPIKGKLDEALKSLLDIKSSSEIDKLERRWAMRESIDSINILRPMHPELRVIYLACLAREMKHTDFDWFMESCRLLYNLRGMCIALKPSHYGSQHDNWRAWKRLHEALDPVIENELSELEEEDEEE